MMNLTELTSTAAGGYAVPTKKHGQDCTLLADCCDQHRPADAACVVGCQQQAVQSQLQDVAALATQLVEDIAADVNDEDPQHKHAQSPAATTTTSVFLCCPTKVSPTTTQESASEAASNFDVFVRLYVNLRCDDAKPVVEVQRQLSSAEWAAHQGTVMLGHTADLLPG